VVCPLGRRDWETWGGVIKWGGLRRRGWGTGGFGGPDCRYIQKGRGKGGVFSKGRGDDGGGSLRTERAYTR